MNIGGARYRNLKFFLTNRLELIKRTGKIFTARSYYHGNSSVFGVEHTLILSREKVDDFGAEPIWGIVVR